MTRHPGTPESLAAHTIRRFANKDSIETFRFFFEIVKYGTSMLVALMAITGVLYRVEADSGFSVLGASTVAGVRLDYIFFTIAIVITLWTFVKGHTVIATATAAILDDPDTEKLVQKAADLRWGAYRHFSVFSAIALCFWTLTLLLKVIGS